LSVNFYLNQDAPKKPGDYNIRVKLGDKHIKGSPFRVKHESGASLNDTIFTGPALKEQCIINNPTYFKIIAKDENSKIKNLN
jgi:hypothetical protein